MGDWQNKDEKPHDLNKNKKQAILTKVHCKTKKISFQ